MLIAFEFFYMASPFAIYFYSVYGPGLNFVNDNPTLAWLSTVFLPHMVVETSSMLVNLHNVIGASLAAVGLLAFCVSAGQVYYYKLARKGAVTGGIYNFIRHPQYVSLVICSFGLLLLWPRYIVLLSFIAMLFAYYFLAKVEENECEEKFGQTYIEYKNKTNMFLPFRVPLMDRLPGLPRSGLKRYLAILALYVVTSVVTIVLANGMRSWSLDSLYAFYSKDAAYISVAKMEEDTLKQTVDVALANPEVLVRLKGEQGGAGTKFINYVVPTEWYVPEIPMNPVEGAGDHHSPAGYNKNLYKIIFTRAELRAGQEAEGREILLNTVRRVPIVEVWVDWSQKWLVDIKNPPATIRYANIPVPLY